jgi:hypothetical protein
MPTGENTGLLGGGTKAIRRNFHEKVIPVPAFCYIAAAFSSHWHSFHRLHYTFMLPLELVGPLSVSGRIATMHLIGDLPVGAYCLLAGPGDDGGNTAAIMMMPCGGGGDSLLSLYGAGLANVVVLLIFVVILTLLPMGGG